jgi:hypothetical protein
MDIHTRKNTRKHTLARAFTLTSLFAIACLVSLTLAGAFASTAQAADFKVEKQAGDYSVTIVIDKNPPSTGKNNVAIEIRDKSGTAVADMKVRVEYSMPAMAGMPAANYKTDAKADGGKYTAVMDLTMSGTWNVVVKFKKSGGKIDKITFSVDAH